MSAMTGAEGRKSGDQQLSHVTPRTFLRPSDGTNGHYFWISCGWFGVYMPEVVEANPFRACDGTLIMSTSTIIYGRVEGMHGRSWKNQPFCCPVMI